MGQPNPDAKSKAGGTRWCVAFLGGPWDGAIFAIKGEVYPRVWCAKRAQAVDKPQALMLSHATEVSVDWDLVTPWNRSSAPEHWWGPYILRHDPEMWSYCYGGGV